MTSLTTIYARHHKATLHFEKALAEPLAENPRELIKSLIKLHQDFSHQTRELINDLPDVPVKPNTDMQTPEEKFASVNWSNDAEVYQHARQHTQSIHSLYRKILDNNGIPDGISAQLEKQASRLSQSLNKLDRVVSTGAERDMRV